MEPFLVIKRYVWGGGKGSRYYYHRSQGCCVYPTQHPNAQDNHLYNNEGKKDEKEEKEEKEKKMKRFWIKDINNDTGRTDSGSNWGNFNIMNIQR